MVAENKSNVIFILVHQYLRHAFFCSVFSQDFPFMFFFSKFECDILWYRLVVMCSTWYSLSFMNLWFVASLILENYQPLIIQIFVLVLSFFYWYSHYSCVTLFITLPQFLVITFDSYHLFFSCFLVQKVPFNISSRYDSFLSCLQSTDEPKWHSLFLLCS